MPLVRFIAALCFCALALPAATVQKIAVNQVDLYLAGKLVEAKSHIGVVDVTYTPDPTGVQWINIVQTPASGSPRWLVRNLILLSQAYLHAPTYRISRYVDLLVTSGTNLSGTSYLYSYVITNAPLTTIPTIGLTAGTATVAVARMQTNSGLANAPTSMNSGAAPNLLASSDPSLSGSSYAPPPVKEETNNTDQTPVVTGDPDMPNVTQGSMQCVPGAMANSMQWLAKKGKIKLSEDPKKTLSDLAAGMSTDATKGSMLDSAISGLSSWAAGKSIPLNIEFQTDGAYLGLPTTGDIKDKNGNTQAKGRGAPNWEFLFGEKQKGQDVIMIVDRLTHTISGTMEVFHHAVVVEWAGTVAGQRSVTYRDDNYQNGGATTKDQQEEIGDRHESMNIDSNGNVERDLFDTRLRAMIAESPVLAQTSALPAILAPTFIANPISHITSDPCSHSTDPVSRNALLLFHPNGSMSYLGTASASIPGMVDYSGNSAAAHAKGPGMYRGFSTIYDVVLALIAGPFGLFGTSTTMAGGDGNLPGGCSIVSTADVVQGVPYTTAANGNGKAIGDPVSSATGELFSDYDPDLALGGPLSLSFRRYYGSMLGINDFYSALGNNWMHNFDKWLTVSGSNATAQLGRGRVARFRQSGTTWSMLGPDRFALQLISSGGGYKLMDPEARLIYTFTAAGALTRIEDRNGNALTITQAASGNGPTLVADGLGRSLAFTYTGNNLTQVKDQTGRTVSFSYTGGNLTKVTDAAGSATSFTYTQGSVLQGLLTGTTLPVGNVFRNQTYDSFGRVSRQTDAAGNALTFSYTVSSIGGNTDVSDALSNTSRYAHDNLASVTELSDPYGITAQRSYDRANRLAGLTDRLGNQTSAVYHDPTGYPASSTDALGNTTTYTWTAQAQAGFTYYNLTKIAYADGTSAAFTYDASGNNLSNVDQAGGTTTFTYSATGQLLTSTSATGGVTTFAYNKDATLASRKSAAGDLTAYEYDGLSRRTKTTYADGSTRTRSFDTSDRVSKITDELGKAVIFGYDKNGHVASVTNRAGGVTQYGYDTSDRLTTVTDASGKIWKLAYEARGLLRQATNGAGEAVVFARDSLGRVTSMTDAGGKASKYGYDRESGWISASDALGNNVSVVRDAVRRIVQSRTPLLGTFARTYDKANRLTALSDPLNRATGYQYDGSGRLAQLTLADAGVVKFTMDAAGNRTAILDPSGNATTQSFDKMNRLVSRTDPLGRATSIGYDQRNRVSTVTLPVGIVNYAFDQSGRLTQASYSDGVKLSYAYDDNGLLISADGLTLTRDANGRVSSSNGIAATRDGAGRITSVTLATNKTVNYAYDARGLLSTVTDWTGAITTFTYDDGGELSSIQRPNQVNTAFTYDKNGRLATKTEAMGDNVLAALTLTRDAAGQVTAADRNQPLQPDPPAGLTPLPRDAAGQVTLYSYDANGLLGSDGVTNYTQDVAGRLLSYTGANGSDTFTYDALGAWTSRTANSFVWNYAFRKPAVSVLRSADGTQDLRYHVHRPDGRLLYSIEADGTRRWFHFDERGNTLMLTADDGTIYEAYAVTPMGESVTVVNPQAAPAVRQAGAGKLDGLVVPPNPHIFGGETGSLRDAISGVNNAGPSGSPGSTWVNPVTGDGLNYTSTRTVFLPDHFDVTFYNYVDLHHDNEYENVLTAFNWISPSGGIPVAATLPAVTGSFISLRDYTTDGTGPLVDVVGDLSGPDSVIRATTIAAPYTTDETAPFVDLVGDLSPQQSTSAARTDTSELWLTPRPPGDLSIRISFPNVRGGAFKISENESPRPEDRVMLNLNYFDAPTTGRKTNTPTALQGHPENPR